MALQQKPCWLNYYEACMRSHAVGWCTSAFRVVGDAYAAAAAAAAAAAV